MTTEQPEALRLADELCEAIAEYPEPTALEAQAAAELRRQHARITELESQLAQRFDAADMATAAAQGFRDGAAAPAQPVAEPAKGAAYAALPEPLEIDWPELHSQALGCGVEDRGLHNRYECAEYGWQDGVDKCAERVPEQIFDADQLRAFADATYMLRASHGQAPADAAPSAGAVAGPDDIDAIALTRYKVVHSHDSMFHRFAVVAGDGKQQLYLGRETECQNMTRKFAGAFLDGAFYQSQIAAAPTPAPSPAPAVGQEPPGIHALMCVISSLRDTAHFSDEEGEVTDDLRTLRDWSLAQAAAPQPVAREPLDEARRLFDAGWKAAALFCDREDVVADGIIGFGACPQFEAAFSAAHGIKGGQHVE